jgi:hypothetical protein
VARGLARTCRHRPLDGDQHQRLAPARRHLPEWWPAETGQEASFGSDAHEPFTVGREFASVAALALAARDSLQAATNPGPGYEAEQASACDRSTCVARARVSPLRRLGWRQGILPGVAGCGGSQPVQLRRRGFRKSAVYDRAMGLFRSRGRKNRGKAAAELLKEQARTVKAQAEAARREVTAEERPNPDQPGWGRTIGQEIGRARENRRSQE